MSELSMGEEGLGLKPGLAELKLELNPAAAASTATTAAATAAAADCCAWQSATWQHPPTIALDKRSSSTTDKS